MSGEKQDPAVQLLNSHIHALDDPDFGHLNFMPFMQETDLSKAIKLKTCQAIVRLFNDHGYKMSKGEEAAPVISRDIAIHCRMCSKLLLKTYVNEDGVANVPAASVISTLSKLESECPHHEVTPERQRQRIEQAYLASQGNE